MTYKVSIWKIEHLKKRKRNPYRLRWTVGGGVPFVESFATEGAADSFRADLKSALNRGEPFSRETGLPASMEPAEPELSEESGTSCLDFMRNYVEHKWKRGGGHSRRGRADVLRDILVPLLPDRDDRPEPKAVSEVLRRFAFRPQVDLDDAPFAVKHVLTWIRRHSPDALRLCELSTLRHVLDELTLCQDRSLAAPNYFNRRHAVLYNLMEFGVTEELFGSNPLNNPKLKWEKPNDLKAEEEIDPREVGNARQVEAVLTGLTYVGKRGSRLVAFFAIMYFAMARPEEIVKLTVADCDLPESGWGSIFLSGATPSVGRDWTDSGKVHEQRGLKHRGRKATRQVPLAPRGVQYLREHLRQFGTSPDGRLFRTLRDGPITTSTYNKVWQPAREFGLSPADQASPLLYRPYSLRHSGISTRRTAGVPAKQVAQWAGNSVQVLERVYSKVLEGYDDRWMKQMDEFYDPDAGGT